jgi:hypothetical protein
MEASTAQNRQAMMMGKDLGAMMLPGPGAECRENREEKGAGNRGERVDHDYLRSINHFEPCAMHLQEETWRPHPRSNTAQLRATLAH